MKKFNSFVLITVLLGLFFMVPAADAHRPEQGVENGLTEIPDSSTSFAYYRDFDSENTFHVYSIPGEAGKEFHAGINIPQLDGLQRYGVTLALFGPGLPDVNLPDIDFASFPATGLESQVADGSVGAVIAPSEVSKDFYEPFTQTNYWGRQSLDITFPADGEYYLLVWQPEGLPGKYVLDTGRAEVFGPGDLLRFPVWWWNTRAYFDQLPVFWLISASIAALLLVGLRVRQRSLAVQRTR